MVPLLDNIAFQGVDYDNESNTLCVIFRNGHGTKYAHENVPKEIYDEFKESNFSKRYYYKNIQHEYEHKIAFLTSEDRAILNFEEYDTVD